MTSNLAHSISSFSASSRSTLTRGSPHAVAYDLDEIDACFRGTRIPLPRRRRRRPFATRGCSSHARTPHSTARQLPATTVDWVNIDHRRLAPVAAGDLGAYLLATCGSLAQSSIRIEAVHRLSKLGAVVTHVIEGTSQQGFSAEWRTIELSTYEGDKINRIELFDEEDLDAAVARFDELERSPQPPGNSRDADLGTLSRRVQSPRHGRLSCPEQFERSVRRPPKSTCVMNSTA